MYVCTGAHEGQTLERAANMIIFLLLLKHLAIIHILSIYIVIINTIVQTSKLATWQKS